MVERSFPAAHASFAQTRTGFWAGPATPIASGLGMAGEVEDVISRCRGLQRSGAQHLSFGPPLGPDPLAAVRLLGEQVLPALNEPS